jgi:hypothetical protein
MGDAVEESGIQMRILPEIDLEDNSHEDMF